MRLLDLTVSKTFVGQPLDAESWYLRLELPDGLDAWKKKGKFSMLEANQMLAAAEVDFMKLQEKFKAAVGEAGQVELEPTLWLNDNGELKLTTRCLMKIKLPEESIEQKLSELKEKLKQDEIYLKVKML